MAYPSQKQSRRNDARLVAVVLLVISIVLAFVYMREGENGPFHSIQRAVMSITQPIASVGASVQESASEVATNIDDAQASSETLSALRAENAELKAQIALLEEYRQQAEQYSSLLNTTATIGQNTVTARVIARSANSWDQTLTLNIGENEGVQVGYMVLGPGGVAGQVVSVADTRCEMRLITDQQSGIAVVLQSSNQPAIVNGSINGLLYLNNLNSDVNVEVGEVVVTSGLGGSYLRGAIVGTVTKVINGQGGSSRQIVVSQNCDLESLSVVSVVIPETASQ